MEFLIVVCVGIITFMWGWNAREYLARKQSERFFEKLAEQVEKEEETIIKIKIEKHDNVLYAYSYDNSMFIAQGSSREELENKLAEKFPGKRFGCTEDNLKEIGFRV